MGRREFAERVGFGVATSLLTLDGVNNLQIDQNSPFGIAELTGALYTFSHTLGSGPIKTLVPGVFLAGALMDLLPEVGYFATDGYIPRFEEIVLGDENYHIPWAYSLAFLAYGVAGVSKNLRI